MVALQPDADGVLALRRIVDVYWPALRTIVLLEGEVVVGVGRGVNLEGVEVDLFIFAVLRCKVEAEGEITVAGISKLIHTWFDHRVLPSFASSDRNDALDFGIALSFLNKNHYATKPMFNYGPNAVGPNVFPLHPTQVCPGKTKVAHAGRPVPVAPDKTPASHLPPCRSKYYLPTPLATLSCPFIL